MLFILIQMNSNLAVRKVGLNGLICLLNTTKLTNFLPSSQASQAMNLSQVFF
jgi:hypothetical protein